MTLNSALELLTVDRELEIKRFSKIGLLQTKTHRCTFDFLNNKFFEIQLESDFLTQSDCIFIIRKNPLEVL